MARSSRFSRLSHGIDGADDGRLNSFFPIVPVGASYPGQYKDAFLLTLLFKNLFEIGFRVLPPYVGFGGLIQKNSVTGRIRKYLIFQTLFLSVVSVVAYGWTCI